MSYRPHKKPNDWSSIANLFNAWSRNRYGKFIGSRRSQHIRRRVLMLVSRFHSKTMSELNQHTAKEASIAQRNSLVQKVAIMLKCNEPQVVTPPQSPKTAERCSDDIKTDSATDYSSDCTSHESFAESEETSSDNKSLLAKSIPYTHAIKCKIDWLTQENALLKKDNDYLKKKLHDILTVIKFNDMQQKATNDYLITHLTSK